MVARKVARKKSTPSTKTKPVSKAPANPVQELQSEILKLEEKLEKAREKQLATSGKLLERQKTQLTKANTKLATLRERKRAIALKVKTKKTAANQNQLNKVTETLNAQRDSIAQIKDAIAETRELHNLQKQSMRKVAATKKAMAAFEKEWTKKELSNKKPSTQNPVTKSERKAPSAASSTTKKPGRPKKAQPNTGDKIEKNTVKSKTARKTSETATTSKKSTTKSPVKKPPKKRINKPKVVSDSAKASSVTPPAEKPPTKLNTPPPVQTGIPLEVEPEDTNKLANDSSLIEQTTEPKKDNPADAMTSEPGRSIFDPAKDM